MKKEMYKKIYHVTIKYNTGHSCEQWCYGKNARERFIGECRAGSCKSLYVTEVQVDTYTKTGEKTEYYE